MHGLVVSSVSAVERLALRARREGDPEPARGAMRQAVGVAEMDMSRIDEVIPAGTTVD